jgi:hypothetical protein
MNGKIGGSPTGESCQFYKLFYSGEFVMTLENLIIDIVAIIIAILYARFWVKRKTTQK